MPNGGGSWSVVSNVSQVQSRLVGMGESIDDSVAMSMIEAGRVVSEKARGLANDRIYSNKPKFYTHTLDYLKSLALGHLNNIFSISKQGNTWRFEYGTRITYASFVEFGGGGTKAHHIISDACKLSSREVTSIFAGNVAGGLRQIQGRLGGLFASLEPDFD